MEIIKQFIEWISNNKENLVGFFILLGALLESLNAMFPTKDKTSFLEKAGKLVSKFTAKIPSNLKKVEVVKKEEKKDVE